MRLRSLAAVLLLTAPLSALGFAVADGPVGAAGIASHVVIAVIDTGINPYHDEFRDAAYAMDPHDFVSGYPPGAQRLDLCLDALAECADFGAAWRHDRALWQGVQPGRLYWFPGTRVIGAISLAEAGAPFAAPTVVYDDVGHGTATASLAAGASLGACPDCLIVSVEGPGDAALAWVRNQSWIDIVSNSWGLFGNLDYPHGLGRDGGAELTHALVDQGKTVLFSAGNGFSTDAGGATPPIPDYLVPGESTYTSQYTGPDWVITVGAVDARNGQPIAAAARPVDIVAAGLEVTAARSFARSEARVFDGTSASAPTAAGVFGATLLELRRALGDAREGPRDGEVVAEGARRPNLGPLGDGALTRQELQRLVFGTAQHCEVIDVTPCDPVGAWPTPNAVGWTVPLAWAVYPAFVGYGEVSKASAALAAEAGLGDGAPPRPHADRWAFADSVARQQLWGTWRPHGAKPADIVG